MPFSAPPAARECGGARVRRRGGCGRTCAPAPPIYAEDMYRPDVYGLATGEATLTVTDGKEAKEKVAPASPPAKP